MSSNEKGSTNPKPTRCKTCNKKVGLTGFKCRCGGIYCAIHRYEKEHACSYDYAGESNKQLETNLIKVDNRRIIAI